MYKDYLRHVLPQPVILVHRIQHPKSTLNPIHPYNHMPMFICPSLLCIPAIRMYAHTHTQKPPITHHHAMSSPWLHACHLPRFPLAYPPCALVVRPPTFSHLCHPFITYLVWKEILDMWLVLLKTYSYFWRRTIENNGTTTSPPPCFALYIDGASPVKFSHKDLWYLACSSFMVIYKFVVSTDFDVSWHDVARGCVVYNWGCKRGGGTVGLVFGREHHHSQHTFLARGNHSCSAYQGKLNA